MAISIKNASPMVLMMVMIAIFADIFIWSQIFSAGSFLGVSFGHPASATVLREYFFDVGQGDSELVIFPGNITVMVDAGPTDAVVGDLQNVLTSGDTYIDLAIISQPQLDDFDGFNFMLDHYRVGAFIYNGREPESDWSAWDELKAKIKAKGIPFITLGRGDKIDFSGTSDGRGRGDDEIDMLSPNLAFAQSAAIADTGLVEFIKTREFNTLLSADIGFNVEDWLVANRDEWPVGLRAEVLKISDHGSKYSSGDEFLGAVNPSIAAIEVGVKNKSGDPASSTLARLASTTHALVLRTDHNGTIEIYPDNGTLKIAKEK